MIKTYTTPAGESYKLYDDLLSGYHSLIAGATGSGKSVMINGLISRLLYNFPSDSALFLIDPKMVELYGYKDLPHTIFYASEQGEIASGLTRLVNLMMNRYTEMRSRGQRKTEKGKIYIIIDEYASICQNREAVAALRKIAELGRAANIFIILATQRPTADVIDKRIAVNIDTRLALRTATAQDSRNIIGTAGAEKLPRTGSGLLASPDHLTPCRVAIPFIPEAEIKRLIDHWKKQN